MAAALIQAEKRVKSAGFSRAYRLLYVGVQAA
jgi:hypothetical protein